MLPVGSLVKIQSCWITGTLVGPPANEWVLGQIIGPLPTAFTSYTSPSGIYWNPYTSKYSILTTSEYVCTVLLSTGQIVKLPLSALELQLPDYITDAVAESLTSPSAELLEVERVVNAIHN